MEIAFDIDSLEKIIFTGNVYTHTYAARSVYLLDPLSGQRTGLVVSWARYT